jgi:hypothetical protein
MIHIHICNDSDAVWRFLYIITCTSVRSCGSLCGQIFCIFRCCFNMLWIVGNEVPVPPDSLPHVHLRFISSNLLTRDIDLIHCCEVARRLPVSVCHFPSHLNRHTPFWQQCSIAKHIYNKRCVIQATLVIRDLTLRVFAITRFRGKKAVRKLYCNFAVTVYGGGVTVWRVHQLVTSYQYQCERECWAS